MTGSKIKPLASLYPQLMNALNLLLLAVAACSLMATMLAINEVSASVGTPLPRTCIICNKWTKQRDRCANQAGSCKWINKHAPALQKALLKRHGSLKKAYAVCKGDFGVGFEPKSSCLFLRTPTPV